MPLASLTNAWNQIASLGRISHWVQWWTSTGSNVVERNKVGGAKASVGAGNLSWGGVVEGGPWASKVTRAALALPRVASPRSGPCLVIVETVVELREEVPVLWAPGETFLGYEVLTTQMRCESTLVQPRGHPKIGCLCGKAGGDCSWHRAVVWSTKFLYNRKLDSRLQEAQCDMVQTTHGVFADKTIQDFKAPFFLHLVFSLQ